MRTVSDIRSDVDIQMARPKCSATRRRINETRRTNCNTNMVAEVYISIVTLDRHIYKNSNDVNETMLSSVWYLVVSENCDDL